MLRSTLRTAHVPFNGRHCAENGCWTTVGGGGGIVATRTSTNGGASVVARRRFTCISRPASTTRSITPSSSLKAWTIPGSFSKYNNNNNINNYSRLFSSTAANMVLYNLLHAVLFPFLYPECESKIEPLTIANRILVRNKNRVGCLWRSPGSK